MCRITIMIITIARGSGLIWDGIGEARGAITDRTLILESVWASGSNL